jgi:Homeodomain-like domain
MPSKYVVVLTDDQRRHCTDIVRAGEARARTITHAQILLKTDAGPQGPRWTDKAIAEAFGVTTVTVATVRKTMVHEGLEAALRHYKGPDRDYPRKLDGHAESHLIALACSAPPEGHLRWSLRLLSDRMVELGYVDSLSHTTVGETLKKTNCSPGAPDVIASRQNITPSS